MTSFAALIGHSSSNIFIWHFETLYKAIGYVKPFHHGHETPSQEVICHSAVLDHP